MTTPIGVKLQLDVQIKLPMHFLNREDLISATQVDKKWKQVGNPVLWERVRVQLLPSIPQDPKHVQERCLARLKTIHSNLLAARSTWSESARTEDGYYSHERRDLYCTWNKGVIEVRDFKMQAVKRRLDCKQKGAGVCCETRPFIQIAHNRVVSLHKRDKDLVKKRVEAEKENGIFTSPRDRLRYRLSNERILFVWDLEKEELEPRVKVLPPQSSTNIAVVGDKIIYVQDLDPWNPSQDFRNRLVFNLFTLEETVIPGVLFGKRITVNGIGGMKDRAFINWLSRRGNCTEIINLETMSAEAWQKGRDKEVYRAIFAGGQWVMRQRSEHPDDVIQENQKEDSLTFQKELNFATPITKSFDLFAPRLRNAPITNDGRDLLSFHNLVLASEGNRVSVFDAKSNLSQNLSFDMRDLARSLAADVEYTNMQFYDGILRLEKYDRKTLARTTVDLDFNVPLPSSEKNCLAACLDFFSSLFTSLWDWLSRTLRSYF